MNFEPLVTLVNSDRALHVCGAEHDSRSDGTGNFMVAQVYITDFDFVENDMLVDRVGERWKLTHAAQKGFHMTGIVLERVN